MKRKQLTSPMRCSDFSALAVALIVLTGRANYTIPDFRDRAGIPGARRAN